MKLKILLWMLLILLIASAVWAITQTTITINSPADDQWWTNSSAYNINFTVAGNNATYSCRAWTTENISANGTWQGWEVGNASQGNGSESAVAVTNNTPWIFNLTPVVEVTGNFVFGIECNDTAGGNTTWSANRTITGVDTTNPIAFACQGLAGHTVFVNNSKLTDYTPTIKWDNSSDSNFSYYELFFNSDIAGADQSFNMSATNNASLVSALNQTVTMTNTSVDHVTDWWARAYDLAGNNVTGSNCTIFKPVAYRVDNTCSQLYTGWNICALTRASDPKASDLCRETNCEFISAYNSTHDFVTFTNGSTLNENLTFDSEDADWNSTVFVYVGANQTWENRSWSTHQNISFTFTNGTDYPGSGYNLIPMLNQICTANLTKIDESISGNSTDYLATPANVTYLVWRNNSLQKNLAFVSNWTIYSGVTPAYGESVWAYFNNETGISSWGWNMSGEGC